jgi:hypothetical protein
MGLKIIRKIKKFSLFFKKNISFSFLIVAKKIAQVQSSPGGSGSGTPNTIDPSLFIPQALQSIDFENVVQNILTAVFVLSGVVATIYLIWGGYQYITAGGGEGAESGKKTIINAIIGLIVIIISWALVKFVTGKIGATQITGP